MSVKKQQMRLQLQQQPQRRHNRTGFETLLDQTAENQGTSPSTAYNRSGSATWSPADAAALRQAYHDHQNRSGPAAGPSAAVVPTDGTKTSPSLATEDNQTTVITPPPQSPLSLPSPYYDRNPIVAFPFNRHHQHQLSSRSLAAAATCAATTVPLANVQNVAYPGAEQDSGDHHLNGTKYYYQPRHHQSFKPGGLTGGRDDDKENIKQQDAECLQQQLDEVLKACVDYEERHKGRPQQSATVSVDSPGNTSPSSITSTPPQQNRIKTNGSLPRDAKKTGTGTSSPTTLSPTSPPSTTWPSPSTPPPTVLFPLSPPALSPLSLNATGGSNSDSFFSDNVSSPASPATPMAQLNVVTTCGSPRTRIRTLIPSCLSPSSVTHADQPFGSYKDRGPFVNRLHDGDDCGSKTSPSGLQPSKPSDQPSPVSFQSALPSWQTTTTWLCSSPFAVDSLDGGGGGGGGASTATTVSVAAADRATEAAEQRRKLLVELSAHKSRLVELHLRRDEIDRELIIETALLRAELDAADNETRQSENIVDGLDRSVAECRQQMDSCTVKQQEQRSAADLQLASYRQELQGLRSRLESIEGDDELKAQIRTSIDKQTELLEAEQKLYEDVEFGLLEEEAGWLARREELHRDRAAAVAVRRARRARAEWLRAQLDQLRTVGDDQLRALKHDINAATLSIQQGHKKLQDLDVVICSISPSPRDQLRRHHMLPSDSSPVAAAAAAAETDHQIKSLDWLWNDQQRKSPTSSSWYSASGPVGYSSPHNMDAVMANNFGAMTNSMTTTCCSSMGSSGGEDDGCRPASEDSMSRMSMSTIFDGGASVKMRPKNKTSPSDITKRPLTRYLPVRYEDDGAAGGQTAFDLRAHIESAGHQLDDGDDEGPAGRHFWIDGTSCRGYLKKLSGTGGRDSRRSGRRKWLKRWFVFDRRSRTLSYYHHRSNEEAADKKNRPRASIRFQDIQEVYVDHNNSCKGQGCAFVVKTEQRTFYLSAVTGQAVRVWVDVIFTGAEGYREYLKGSVDDGIRIATPRIDSRRDQRTKS